MGSDAADAMAPGGAALAQALLEDAFERVHETVPQVVAGLGADDLLWRPGPAANSIAWLVWHLARVQDDHVCDLVGRQQVWTEEGWDDRFGLPYASGDVGFGHSPDEVRAFTLEDPTLLTAYHEAVHTLTLAALRSFGTSDYARVVDRRWDPPVTLGVRLVSVVNDTTQHVGQAAYVRGLLAHRS